MATQFSEDGKYFAQISSDGRLKIWNTISNSFEQEFTPDYHLTTPCTCLHFWQPETPNNKTSPSPKKKKRKEAPNLPNIVLGTTSGLVLIYSIAKASVDYTIDSKANSQIGCLSTTNNNLLYSGADQNILEWHLKKKILKSQWKGGNETISSILALPNGKNILTASKNIKLWDVEKREILKTFTGHSSNVTFMQHVNLPDADAYLLSGSKADRLLSCWKLSSSDKQKNAVCNYLMEDVVQNVSINVADDGLTSIAATVRSGVVHIYHNKLNGKCDKPLKPKTTIHVVSDTGQKNDLLSPIKIFGAVFRDSETVCIGHGSEVILTFENLVRVILLKQTTIHVVSDTGQKNDLLSPIKIFGAVFRDSETVCIGHGSEVILTFENLAVSSYQKVQCLIRADPHASKKSKETIVTKVKTPLVGDDVHYLSSHTSAVSGKRRSEGQTDIPMKQRLENLTLSKSDSQVPKVDNVAQLLLQGLHSKDKNLLRTALCKRDENIIRNTVKRLPVTVFEGLIKELSSLVHGKTISSHFGALWLKHFAQVHAGILISNPNLSELFSGVLGSIYSRISLQTPLNRLRGKLELLVPQVSTSNNAENNEDDDALLVFNDKDESESESEDDEMQIEIPSDSDNENWEESDQDGNVEENHVDGSGSDSDSVVMVENEGSDSD